MPMRRQMQNKGELAVMVVCVVVGFLLAAQLRSVKLRLQIRSIGKSS